MRGGLSRSSSRSVVESGQLGMGDGEVGATKALNQPLSGSGHPPVRGTKSKVGHEQTYMGGEPNQRGLQHQKTYLPGGYQLRRRTCRVCRWPPGGEPEEDHDVRLLVPVNWSWGRPGWRVSLAEAMVPLVVCTGFVPPCTPVGWFSATPPTRRH